MPTTSNFGWTTPADTDLVKDGALAIRTLGNGIDTSMAELKGGTTGQILSKTSNTDMDFTWINNDQGDITGVTAGTGISGGGTSGTVTITNSMATEITAAGDIIVGTGSGTFDNLPIGTTGQVLTADTTVSPYKVKWATASSGSFTLVTNSSFTSTASHSVNNCFTSTYERYLICIDVTSISASSNVLMRLRASSTDTTTNYEQEYISFGGNGGSPSIFENPNGTDEWAVAYCDSTLNDRNFAELTLNNVQLAKNTSGKTFRFYPYAADTYAEYGGVFQNSTTQFDGFTIYTGSATMTGSVKVYGYSK